MSILFAKYFKENDHVSTGFVVYSRFSAAHKGR